uniref:Serpentine receptor class gamma n=1 Tax=Globodera rostochiensis TaxID=31243 RepID=A0A914HP03_GLORO
MATLFAYKLRHSSQIQSYQRSKNENKMTIYTVATFFGQFITAIFMIFVYMLSNKYLVWHHFGKERHSLANFNQSPWVNDLTTVVIPAWLLLWASTKMREIVVKKNQNYVPLRAPCCCARK